ncbi:hypothetical protein BDV40DRAFT_204478 [Aspergillus tamarii]|uniref:Amino acid permease/ SLC12A domain-containing protein n=1 Tax=Aspergillus tamarii TaxID=41984 RepID=A0A5N6UQ65_ASPTM|nr:hypothetical protein BDV40DRAFT_204478 [Aspergillus tamarii]
MAPCRTSSSTHLVESPLQSLFKTTCNQGGPIGRTARTGGLYIYIYIYVCVCVCVFVSWSFVIISGVEDFVRGKPSIHPCGKVR